RPRLAQSPCGTAGAAGGATRPVHARGLSKTQALGFSFLPTASGNTHMARTAKTPKPITNQKRWWLPAVRSQKAKPITTRSVNSERAAFTSCGIGPFRFWMARSIIAERLGSGHVGPPRATAQLGFQMRVVIAIEEVAEKPAIQVRRAKYPVGNGKRQVHIGFHHQSGVMVGGVVTP